jgi:patatin-like phospholipase/acyl hydrolase
MNGMAEVYILEKKMHKNKRRILALDGGGIKGVFAAAFLEAIEENTGKCIADHFDLIAGTSTGGIIALGLGLGMSAREILQFYVNEGPRIFGQPNSLDSSNWLLKITGWFDGHRKSSRQLVHRLRGFEVLI